MLTREQLEDHNARVLATSDRYLTAPPDGRLDEEEEARAQQRLDDAEECASLALRHLVAYARLRADNPTRMQRIAYELARYSVAEIMTEDDMLELVEAVYEARTMKDRANAALDYFVELHNRTVEAALWHLERAGD